jgi:hypothetical protein
MVLITDRLITAFYGTLPESLDTEPTTDYFMRGEDEDESEPDRYGNCIVGTFRCLYGTHSAECIAEAIIKVMA